MQNDFLRSVLDANAVYADAFAQSDPKLLAKLAKGQSPRIFWLGCSDSRVSAELSTGVAPGSIFVHRNVGQVFHSGDLSALAALHYAVNVLKVEAVIVCGHTCCGGVRAAMGEAIDEVANGGPLNHTAAGAKLISSWIEPIKTIALKQLASPPAPQANSGKRDPLATYDPLSFTSLGALTDSHVAKTVQDLAQTDVVKEAWAAGMELSIHGWVYELATARLVDLGVGVVGPHGKPAYDSTSRPSSYAGSYRDQSPGPDSGDEA